MNIFFLFSLCSMILSFHGTQAMSPKLMADEQKFGGEKRKMALADFQAKRFKAVQQLAVFVSPRDGAQARVELEKRSPVVVDAARYRVGAKRKKSDEIAAEVLKRALFDLENRQPVQRPSSSEDESDGGDLPLEAFQGFNLADDDQLDLPDELPEELPFIDEQRRGANINPLRQRSNFSASSDSDGD
jgi:hypothetical protein